MGLIFLILWFLIGVGASIYGWIQDDDITSKDISLLLLGGVFGPIMIGVLISILKPKSIFNGDYVWFKKIDKNGEDSKN